MCVHRGTSLPIDKSWSCLQIEFQTGEFEEGKEIYEFDVEVISQFDYVITSRSGPRSAAH